MEAELFLTRQTNNKLKEESEGLRAQLNRLKVTLCLPFSCCCPFCIPFLISYKSSTAFCLAIIQYIL